jgi:hypothetical protein
MLRSHGSISRLQSPGNDIERLQNPGGNQYPPRNGADLLFPRDKENDIGGTGQKRYGQDCLKKQVTYFGHHGLQRKGLASITG